MMKDNNFISVVVYLHNDEKYIKKFLDSCYVVIVNKFKLFEFVFVNDFCNDCTINVIEDYFKNIENCTVSIVNLSYYHGIQTAMKAGVDLSIGDYIYEFDNVYSIYDSKLILDVYNESQNGYDIVAASEKKKSKFKVRLFYYIFNKYSFLPTKIEAENFRLYSRRTLNRIDDANPFVIYRRAIYASSGLKKKNIYFDSKEKIKSKKENNVLKTKVNTGIQSLLLLTRFPSVLCNYLLIFFGLIAISMISLFGLSLHYFDSLSNAFLILVCLSIFFSILLLLFKVFMSYFRMLSSYTISKPSYNFESIKKISR